MMTHIENSLDYIKINGQPSAEALELQMKSDNYSFVGVEFPDSYKVGKWNFTMLWFFEKMVKIHKF